MNGRSIAWFESIVSHLIRRSKWHRLHGSVITLFMSENHWRNMTAIWLKLNHWLGKYSFETCFGAELVAQVVSLTAALTHYWRTASFTTPMRAVIGWVLQSLSDWYSNDKSEALVLGFTAMAPSCAAEDVWLELTKTSIHLLLETIEKWENIKSE